MIGLQMFLGKEHSSGFKNIQEGAALVVEVGTPEGQIRCKGQSMYWQEKNMAASAGD